MRILELHLLAFGPFTNITLDLSRADVDLHIVYGPNEAGKSCALRAIQAALFGVPQLTTDNFVHDHRQLRIGASLRNSMGNELRFVRRKGRKGTLLNKDPALGPLPEKALEPFLGGVDGDTFAQVFGIGYEALQRGGDQMRLLKGLCGESLFAASLGSFAAGGRGLAEVLTELDDSAAELFSSKKKSSTIKRAEGNYQEALKERREVELSSSQFQKLQANLEQARSELEGIRGQLRELRAEESRLDRLHKALNPLFERRQLLDELEQLDHVTVLPQTYSADERARCQMELEQAGRHLAALESELDGVGGLREQIAGINVPEGLLENDHLIAALQEHLGAHAKAAHDRERTLQPRRRELQARIQGLIRELGIDGDRDVLARMRLPSDQRVAIQNLANEEKRLRAAPRDLAARRDDIERQLELNRAERERLGRPRDTADLRSAYHSALKQGELTEQIADEAETLARLGQNAARKLAALGLWSGQLAELPGVALPLEETVVRFEDAFAELHKEQKRLEVSQAERSQEFIKVGQQVLALEEGGRVPSEQELDRLRGERDLGWGLVRRVWLEGLDPGDGAVRDYAGSSPLADAYERSVERADVLADRLRREADRVAQLTECRAHQAALAEDLARLGGEIDEVRRRQHQLHRRWREVWSSSGIRDPLMPREMRAWLERCTQLRTAILELEGRESRLQMRKDRHDACCRRLVEALEWHPVPDDVSLNGLLDRAREVIEREAELSQRAGELERDAVRLRRDGDMLADEQTRAAEALAEWKDKWRHAMEQIGCPEDAPAEQANERMSRLEELFRRIDELADIDRRLHDIEDDAQRFADDVRALVLRLAPDLEDWPVERAAGQLRARLDAARADNARLGHLLGLAEQRQDERDACQRRACELGNLLAQLRRLAGVDGTADLAEVERVSHEVTERHKRLHEVEERLLELSGGDSLSSLAAEAERWGFDKLTARLAEVREKIEELEGAREEQAARTRELENQFHAADGSDRAADADQRALGILSRMHADAERFLKLRLAAALLRHHIERFRTENQDPLLTRAAAMFARMTCGEFSGLRTEYTDQDRPVIVGVRRDDTLVPVVAMSDGTRDQLYLALRLAYLERRLIQQEPLPLVADDLLINFDNDRALATLEVLAELSRQTQVILFTHHRHIVDMAEASMRSAFSLHELDGPPPQLAAALTRRPR